MRAAKVQASLRIRAVSPEPSLLAHTSNEYRGTFRQKNRSLAPLNGWACAVEICNDGMLEDTNSLDGAQMTCAPCEDSDQPTHPRTLTRVFALGALRRVMKNPKSFCWFYWDVSFFFSINSCFSYPLSPHGDREIKRAEVYHQLLTQ